jgi:DNA-directed RNA polymerase subunit RPC12/RpoP
MPPPAPPTMAAAPIEQTHRSDLLPATCPHCGGPIRSYEVKWTGKQTAACPYCGSHLPMRKP